MVHIVSWNVMYRKYEEEYNPESPILKKYIDEKLRIEEIIIFLRDNILSNSIICLQEVSNDLLDKLTEVFVDTFNIFSVNVEEKNNIVTLAPKKFYKEACRNSNHISHGYLIVNNDEIRVMNCHLKPQRFCITDVLYSLINMRKEGITTFIAGDFNEQYKLVHKKLHSIFICPYYGKTYKKKPIDHIIFDLDNINSYKVSKKSNELSDHEMIILDI